MSSAAPTLKALLRSAKEALSNGDHQGAVDCCSSIIARDGASYEAHVFKGKALFKLGRAEEAVAAYSKATQINPSQAPAYQGLLEAHSFGNGDDAACVPLLEKLAALMKEGGNGSKAFEYGRQRAAALRRLGRVEEAAEQAAAVLGGPDGSAGVAEPARLELLCAVVDGLLRNPPRGSSGVLPELEEVCRLAPHWSPSFVGYQEARLARLMEERHRGADSLARAKEAVAAALQAPPCPSPIPYLSLLLLLEEEEAEGKDPGGIHVPRASPRGFLRARLTNAFPGTAAGASAWGRELAERCPTEHADKRTAAAAVRLLKLGLEGGSGLPMDWVALAALQCQRGQHKECLATAQKAVQALRSPQAPWSRPSLGLAARAAIRLQLLSARCRLRLGDAEEAEAAYERLTAVCSGPQLMEARRGQAEAAMAAGRPDAAKSICRAILREGGPAAPPWAKAAMGWLHVGTEGCAEAPPSDLEKAQQVLEAAVAESSAEGAPSWEAAQLRYWLGRVQWARGGQWRADRQHAHAQFVAAAAPEGPSQAAAFAWLGEFYFREVGDNSRARACFQKALSLDASLAIAGEGLFDILQASGSGGLRALCEGMIARAPGAAWAHRRLGMLQLQEGEAEASVASLQKALRADASSAEAWEWLGAAYHSLGRTTAASKSFSRSLELSPGRLYARVALGSVQLDLGNLGAAEEQLSAAAPSEHPVALIGLALCALRRCASDVFAGSPGTSALSLRLATSHAASAARLCPTSVAAWQTLGDCHLMHHRATPVEHRGEGGEAEGWGLRAEKQREARRAYARALHLRPGLAGLWGAAAASLHHEAALREAHVALGPGEAPALRKQAERLLRGALRINPAEPRFWAALAEVAQGAAKREAALCRALTLDPKYAAAWTALARLYADSGNRLMAEKAYEQARIANPEFAPTWEGMAAMAVQDASLGLLPTFGSSAAELLEYAAQLHGSAGVQAAYVISALSGQALQGGSAASARPGRVYCAARRAAEELPLDPLAASALGIASEDRGLPEAAAESHRSAVLLLKGKLSSPQGKGDAQLWLQLRRATRSMARALLACGRPQEAVAAFLEANEALGGATGSPMEEADARRSLAAAQAQAGDPKGAAAILSGILAAPVEGSGLAWELEVRLMAVQASCLAGDAAGAVAHAEAMAVRASDRPGGPLEEAKAAVAKAVAALAASVAIAAPGGPQVRLQPSGTGSQLPAPQLHSLRLPTLDALGSTFLTAELQADVLVAQCYGARLVSGPGAQPPRIAARAVHACPWSPSARRALAVFAAEASPGGARLVSRSPPKAPATAQTLLLWAESVAQGLRPSDTARGAALRAIQAAAHQFPSDGPLAAALARAALRVAQGGPAKPYRGAAAICRRALALSTPGKGGAERTRLELQLLLSEAELNSRFPGSLASASSLASAVLGAANDPRMQAEAKRQAARCRAEGGNIQEAAGLYKETARESGSALALLDVADLLVGSGNAAEAARALEARRGSAPKHPNMKLAEAVALLAAGDPFSARVVAKEGAEEGTTDVGLGQQGKAIVFGAAALSAAAAVDKEAGGGGRGAAQLLGEARRHLTAASGQAIHPPGAAVAEAAAASHLLLALVEDMGSNRKKEERARDHILAAAKLWPRATAPPLLLARAAEAAEAHRRVPAAARAVHSQPWCRGLWESLKAAAARGRSEDPPEVPSQGSKGGGSTLRSEVRLTAGKSADAAWDD